MVGVVLVNFPKAVDSVNYSLLLDKLNLYGCPKTATNWFESYVLGRSQYVCLKSAFSGSETEMRTIHYVLPNCLPLDLTFIINVSLIGYLFLCINVTPLTQNILLAA